jgi:hypothetical protein
MTIKYLLLQDLPKFTQIGIFGLKICHLATLLERRALQRGVQFDLCRPLFLSLRLRIRLERPKYFLIAIASKKSYLFFVHFAEPL